MYNNKNQKSKSVYISKSKKKYTGISNTNLDNEKLDLI